MAYEDSGTQSSPPGSYTPLGSLGDKSASGGRGRKSRLSRVSAANQCTFVGVQENSLESFGDYVHGLSRSFWLSMVLGGFIAPVRGTAWTKGWQFFFLTAMLICGTTCLINCYIKDPPFHLLPADVMVSLIHVPGFYSIFLWGRILGDPTSAVWMVLAQGEQTQKQLSSLITLLGPFLIPAQIVVIGLVWAGYSVPVQMYVNDEPHSNWLTQVHNYSMWIVIPPVVACVVANAAFFAFFVYAMYLQVNALLLKMFLREEVDLEESSGTRAITKEDQQMTREVSKKAPAPTKLSQQGHEQDLDQALASHDYEAFMEMLADDIFRMQDMIDMVCDSWSSLVLLFLTFAFFNILAVFYDFIIVYTGSATYEMTIYVYCIDAFLIASGLGIVLGFMVMGALLTQRMDDLCVETVEVMRAAHVPISKAASTFYYLQTGGRTTMLGFKVYGYRIEWSHAVGFVSLLLTALGFVMSGGSPTAAGGPKKMGHNALANAGKMLSTGGDGSS